MRIINIGTDENILDKNSRSFLRVRDYTVLAEETFYLIFTKNKKVEKIEEEINGKRFVVVPIVGGNKLIQVWQLFSWFRGGGFAPAPHSQTIISSQDAFEIGFLSYIMAKKYNFKLLLQVHTDISTPFFRQESLRNFFQFLLAKYLLKKADAIRVVSRKMKKYLEQIIIINPNIIYWLPIYTDISKFSFDLKKNRTKNILMISRIEEVKNIPLGIRSVKAFRKLSNENIKLRIVGKGNLKQKYLTKYKNFDWIEWADWTENVEQEYHNADLLLITSNYEGWGLTAVESVACGTPVAISPVGVANEFIVDGINGYVARGHDIINITESIYNCIHHQFDVDKMKQSLCGLDTKETFMQKYQKIFLSMI